jgi:hypothetical protein
MQKLGRGFLVLVTGLLSGLALVASAAGTTATHSPAVRHLKVQIKALAMDENHIAYAVGSSLGKSNGKVLVWNVRSGKTQTVSGNKTRGADSTGGSGVFGLAISGVRVAWLVNEGGNLEGDDFLYTSSVVTPKERLVATEHRSGDSCSGGSFANNPSCAGKWLLGLVGSGGLLAIDRWTTDGTGGSQATLNVLTGRNLKQVASEQPSFQNLDANAGRVAAVGADDVVHIVSGTGESLRSVSPSSVKTAALSGHRLVVLTKTRTLELYSTKTGALQKTLVAHGAKAPANLDLQDNVAIYTTGGFVRAVNLSTGKDRQIGKLRGSIAFAHIDGAGVAYAGNGIRATYGKGTLVFVPMARVKAAVG